MSCQWKLDLNSKKIKTSIKSDVCNNKLRMKHLIIAVFSIYCSYHAFLFCNEDLCYLVMIQVDWQIYLIHLLFPAVAPPLDAWKNLPDIFILVSFIPFYKVQLFVILTCINHRHVHCSRLRGCVWTPRQY